MSNSQDRDYLEKADMFSDFHEAGSDKEREQVLRSAREIVREGVYARGGEISEAKLKKMLKDDDVSWSSDKEFFEIAHNHGWDYDDDEETFVPMKTYNEGSYSDKEYAKGGRVARTDKDGLPIYNLGIVIGGEYGQLPKSDAMANTMRDVFLENEGIIDKEKWDRTMKVVSPDYRKKWKDFKKNMEIEVKDGKYINPYQARGYAEGGKIKTFLCVEDGDEFTIEASNLAEAESDCEMWNAQVIREINPNELEEENDQPMKEIDENDYSEYEWTDEGYRRKDGQPTTAQDDDEPMIHTAYAKGGKVKKGNEMIIGGLAGFLLGMFFVK